jgi:2-polyprenyl-3-methyl-5-hydroxy-6-metoxy-1,4-benzoquinol methylase
VQCNLCGADDTSLRYQLNGWNIVSCQRCGLIYVNPMPNAETLRTFYTEDFFQGNRRPAGYADYLRDKGIHVRHFQAYWPLIRQEFPYPGRVLDIGCALGFFLDMARSQGWEAVGIELSEFAAQWARSKLGLDVQTGTLLDAHLPKDCFDVVTLWATIEHLADPIGTLREAHRVLKPGGVILITTGEVEGILDRLSKGLCYWYEPPAHLYYFTTRTLRAMLQKAGFRSLRVQGVEMAPGMIGPFRRPGLHGLNRWLPATGRLWLRLVYRFGCYALELIGLRSPQRVGNIMVALARKP